MYRYILGVFFTSIFLQFGYATAAQLEIDIDRPGSDYRNFDLPTANPQLCAAQCEQDGRCRAFTYVKPGAQGPNARCWLKDQIPNPVRGVTIAISGVVRPAGPPRNPNFEYDIDRPGSDYRNFDLQAANPELCAAQCAQDGRCRAWTYVKPGAQGPNARCWLKDQIPNPVRGVTTTVSGITRAAGPTPPPAAPPNVSPPPAQPPVQPPQPQPPAPPPVTPPPTPPGAPVAFPPLPAPPAPVPLPPGAAASIQGVFVLQGVAISDPYGKDKRFVRIDDMKYDARGGVVHVTALDDGGCAPLKGTPGPGTFQRFRYAWQFSEDVSTLRLGQTVLVSFNIVGDQQKCLDQNPHMVMHANDEHARNHEGNRFYFDPARVSPSFHSGALRGLTMNATLSGRQQNQKVIQIYVTGFSGYRGMELSFEYVYTFQKSQ